MGPLPQKAFRLLPQFTFRDFSNQQLPIQEGEEELREEEEEPLICHGRQPTQQATTTRGDVDRSHGWAGHLSQSAEGFAAHFLWRHCEQMRQRFSIGGLNVLGLRVR